MMDAEKFTDQEIIERVINGEKPLYEIIVRRYNPFLYKIGRSYHYSHEDTQDLMQETFIDAYKHLAQYAGRSRFKTWLIRIMLNNCYRKSKKAAFKNKIEPDLKENTSQMLVNRDTDTQKIVQNHELRQIIESALLRIPLHYRMVFALREMNGMNLAETAQLLQISESNVKVRLNRAKTILRKEIEKFYSPEDLFEFNLVYCDAIVNQVMDAIHKL